MSKKDLIRFAAMLLALVVWIMCIICSESSMPSVYDMDPQERIRQEMRIW